MVYLLLVVSLLLQSIGPAAMAAAMAIYPGQDTPSSIITPGAGQGIWTISCAGKPMWLPLHGEKKIGAASEHGSARVCLICSSAATDSLLPVADFYEYRRTTKALTCRPDYIVWVASHNQQHFHPRAPPLSPHE